MKRFLVLLFLLPTLAHAQGAGTPPYRGVNNWPLIFGTDNTYDIGAVASSRPRTGYFGTSLFTPALTVSGLTATRCTFAGTGGLLSDDADCTFSGSRLTVTDLTVTNFPTFSAGTSTRVPFFGGSGVLSDSSALTFTSGTGVLSATGLTATGQTATRMAFYDTGGALSGDADCTFATDTLTCSRLTVSAGPFLAATGTASAPTIARSADVDDGIVLGEVSYFVRDGIEGVGFSQSSGGSIRLCNTGAQNCATFSQLKASTTYTGIANTTGAITAGTMTNVTGTDGPIINDGTTPFTWTNAQVVALGATTTGDITVGTLQAKTEVLRALVVITGTAAGTTTLTVSCGDATVGAPFNNYVLAGDAKAAANTVYGDAISGAETGASLFDATAKWIPAFLPSYTATTLVTCRFISTGANLSAVTGSTGRVILTTRLNP